jgi:hypothetical protein
MSEAPLKVVLIVGRGRSGSTIFDNVLGGIDGFASAGELHNLWRRAIEKGHHCGCGVPLTECAVWSRALETTHLDPALGRLGVEDVKGWQTRVVRQRHLLQLLRFEPGRETGWKPLDRYVRLLGRAYRAFAEASGARIVVDSSKRPEHAAVVRLVPGIESYYLHLVRDPRAVAYSRQRIKIGPDGVMRRFGILKGTKGWIVRNVEASVLKRRVPGSRFARVLYGHFVGWPGPTVERVLDLVDEPRPELPFEDFRTVRLAPSHTVAGNPSRFRTGPVTLSFDDEWRTRQSELHRWGITAMTLPLLAAYGLPLLPRRNPPLPPGYGEPSRVPEGSFATSRATSGDRGSRPDVVARERDDPW